MHANEHIMAKPIFSHEQLCNLVDIEPAPEETWSDLYREWKKGELEDIWLELKRLEEKRLRKLHNQREHIERLLGIRLNVRIPRKLVDPPTSVVELLEKTDG